MTGAAARRTLGVGCGPSWRPPAPVTNAASVAAARVASVAGKVILAGIEWRLTAVGRTPRLEQFRLSGSQADCADWETGGVRYTGATRAPAPQPLRVLLAQVARGNRRPPPPPRQYGQRRRRRGVRLHGSACREFCLIWRPGAIQSTRCDQPTVLPANRGLR